MHKKVKLRNEREFFLEKATLKDQNSKEMTSNFLLNWPVQRGWNVLYKQKTDCGWRGWGDRPTDWCSSAVPRFDILSQASGCKMKATKCWKWHEIKFRKALWVWLQKWINLHGPPLKRPTLLKKHWFRFWCNKKIFLWLTSHFNSRAGNILFYLNSNSVFKTFYSVLKFVKSYKLVNTV